MEKYFILFVSLTITLYVFPWVTASRCGGNQNRDFAVIPAYYLLLSLEEFDFFVVDNTLNEMYFAIPSPPPFIPDINYKVTIRRASGSSSYREFAMGETPVENSTCVRVEAPLTLVEGFDRAFFTREDAGRTFAQAVWSSCPDKYILSMRCENYQSRQRRCPTSDTSFSVYLQGDMRNAPLADIVHGLWRATGIRFGAEIFTWFFSFGENTLCR